MLKSDRIILARVLYHLKLVDTAKNRELLVIFEQLHKSSCSLDSSVLAAHADLVSEWRVFNQMCSLNVFY